MLRHPFPRTASLHGKPIAVWDRVVRLIHWALVACLAGAVATGAPPGGGQTAWHAGFGLAAAALVAARVVWGFAGPTYARFSAFCDGPAAVIAHLDNLWHGVAPRFIGHDPVSGALVRALLLAIAATSATGLLLPRGPVGMHAGLAALVLVLVAGHVGAVILQGRRDDDAPMRAMLAGYKDARVGDVTAPRRAAHPVAAIVAVTLSLGALAVLATLAP